MYSSESLISELCGAAASPLANPHTRLSHHIATIHPNNIIYGHQIFEVDSFRYQFEIVDNKMPAPVLIWCWISKQAQNILKAH